jgi:hypothetical protein
MRLPVVRGPVTNFTIPPLPPAAVADAYANYDRLCDKLAELQGELADAKDAIEAGSKQAIQDDVLAIVGGGKAKSGVVSQERETAIAELEQRLLTLERAADLAGNDLADAVAANKDEWLAALDQRQTEAVAAYRAALAQTQDAARALGSARRASEWLATFHAGRAKIGFRTPPALISPSWLCCAARNQRPSWPR